MKHIIRYRHLFRRYMQSEVAVSPYVKILFPNTILKVLPVVLRSILFIITIVTFTHAYLVSLVSF